MWRSSPGARAVCRPGPCADCLRPRPPRWGQGDDEGRIHGSGRSVDGRAPSRNNPIAVTAQTLGTPGNVKDFGFSMTVAKKHDGLFRPTSIKFGRLQAKCGRPSGPTRPESPNFGRSWAQFGHNLARIAQIPVQIGNFGRCWARTITHPTECGQLCAEIVQIWSNPGQAWPNSAWPHRALFGQNRPYVVNSGSKWVYFGPECGRNQGVEPGGRSSFPSFPSDPSFRSFHTFQSFPSLPGFLRFPIFPGFPSFPWFPWFPAFP